MCTEALKWIKGPVYTEGYQVDRQCDYIVESWGIVWTKLNSSRTVLNVYFLMWGLYWGFRMKIPVGVMIFDDVIPTKPYQRQIFTLHYLHSLTSRSFKFIYPKQPKYCTLSINWQWQELGLCLFFFCFVFFSSAFDCTTCSQDSSSFNYFLSVFTFSPFWKFTNLNTFPL